MAVSQRRNEERNPFFIEDDEKDEGFDYGNSGRGNQKPRSNAFDDDEDRLEQLIARKEASERRQMESLNNCLVVVGETEEIGIATAQELAIQGEKLDNVERQLDSISAMTKITQKHINNIKSVFGGIKNWFQSKSDQPTPKTEIPHSKLKEALQDFPESTRQLDTSHPHKSAQSDKEESNLRNNSFNNTLDSKLDVLSGGIGRLKNLGLAMNVELDRQNEQLIRLTDKATVCDSEIENQNKQARNLLR